MKQSDFIAQILAADPSMSTKQAKAAFLAITDTIFTSLKEGKSVRIQRVGTLSVTVRKDTTYRNPRTKSLIKKPAHKRIKFSISDIIKAELNQ